MKQHNMKTAAEQAAERYPGDRFMDQRLGAVTAELVTNSMRLACKETLTERAIPAEHREAELKAELAFVKENVAAWEKNAKDGWAAQEAASKREDEALKTIQVLVDASVPHKWGSIKEYIDAREKALSLASERHGITPTKK